MDFKDRLDMYVEGGMITQSDVEDVNAVIKLFKDNYGIELIELLDNYISEEYALNKIKDVLTKRIGKRRGYRDNDVNKYLDKIENKKHSD